MRRTHDSVHRLSRLIEQQREKSSLRALANFATIKSAHVPLPHELYLATEHLPTAAHFSTAAGCTAARLPLGQLATMCAERRVPPRVDGQRPLREQIGS